ncbi:conserved hypothetical protein [Xenorhabdus bovienii str. Jollieti]|uniref:polysaccharide deacetylase family protein n=1 Tax=Xenorhabdus bovienii TaxID=40576 RepID=UPI0001CA89FD|nr:polysaccharide deacetylase family protein [Xenorhabdus bovienii]CDH29312.1 conserved hypothetical protein [Xenorhabdus bovienii str. Jollieti]
MKSINSNILLWFQLIIRERFGIPINASYTEKGIKLYLQKEEKYIILDELQSSFYSIDTKLSFTTWNGCEEGWETILASPLPAPTIKNLPKPLIEKKSYGHNIHYDIIGLTYWILSRIEEINKEQVLDNHYRFPAIESHAYKNNYLNRPIVDEWLHILRQIIEKTWPNAVLKKHQFRFNATHDVDRPYRFKYCKLTKLIKNIAGDVIRKKVFSSIIYAPFIKISNNKHVLNKDLYFTFDWIMNLSEKNNIKSEFYFICGRTDRTKDADYEIEDPLIRGLLRKIHSRGHVIGLHPSYSSFQDPQQIKEEFSRLQNVCAEENIKQKQYGGRMHYLRWSHPETLVAWNNAGLNYDSTLGYADRPGFRCGTCFEYPAINPLTNEILNIRIRPLIVMESSILKYMNIKNTNDAKTLFLYYKNICKKFNGEFTLLWHNSELYNNKMREIYLALLTE